MTNRANNTNVDSGNITQNSFKRGLNTDIHPENIPNEFLADGSRNVQFKLTNQNNRLIPQKRIGLHELHGKIQSENGFPSDLTILGHKQFDGITYIVSKVVNENSVEIGTIPGVTRSAGDRVDGNITANVTRQGLPSVSTDLSSIDIGVSTTGNLRIHNPNKYQVSVTVNNIDFTPGHLIKPNTTPVTIEGESYTDVLIELDRQRYAMNVGAHYSGTLIVTISEVEGSSNISTLISTPTLRVEITYRA